MIRPNYPGSGGKKKKSKKSRSVRKKPALKREQNLFWFKKTVSRIKSDAVKERKRLTLADHGVLIVILSKVIPSKASEYIEKLNSGEIFSVSFSGARNFTVVPDGFLSETERSTIKRTLQKTTDPFRKVVEFSDFEKWALINVDFRKFWGKKNF